jgi:hypothetical protein
MPARINVAFDGRAALEGELPAGWVPAQASAAPSGERLAIAGKRFGNGIGVLANSRLEVRLDKEFRRLRATVGEQGAGRRRISYRVFGDGRLLMHKKAKGALRIDVPVKGVQTLELVVESNPPGTQPVAIAWADARLER